MVTFAMAIAGCSLFSQSKKVGNPDLRTELIRMVEEDQGARKSFDAARVLAVDAKNTQRMKDIVATYGWPTISLVGPRGSDFALVLVQHADRDISFQKQCLRMIDSLLTLGQVNAKNYAYLYDRVAVHEERPQRFATQGRCVGPDRWEPHPLENAAKIDSLRASAGLVQLEEYQERMHALCKGTERW
jgi:hypothetical protein